MKKINRLIIHGFVFELCDETKKFKFEGNIVPEYCTIIPYQNEYGELAIKVNIAVEETVEKHKCKICIYESKSTCPNSLCLENVLFYDIYTNNENGSLQQWHIFIEEE